MTVQFKVFYYCAFVIIARDVYDSSAIYYIGGSGTLKIVGSDAIKINYVSASGTTYRLFNAVSTNQKINTLKSWGDEIYDLVAIN